MYSENNRISLRQMRRLFVFDLFCVSSLIIPRVAAAASGKDGILAILLGTLYAYVYVWIILAFAKWAKGNFLEYAKDNTGKLLQMVVLGLYIIKLFICCVFATKLFSEVIGKTLLEDTDHRIIVLLLLMVSGYMASKGLEVRARIVELLFFVVMVPIFLFLILGVKEIDLTNLMPLFTKSTRNMIYGGYEVFLTFSVLELLLFLIPMIKVRKSDVEKRRKVYEYVSGALVIVTVLNVLLFVVTVGVLGEIETKKQIWSMVNVIQTIQLPGGFIERQDGLILSIWMLSVFTIVSTFLYYISLLSKVVFKVSMQNYFLVPVILLLFGAATITIEIEQFYYYFEIYMKYIGMPQSIVLPLLIFMCGKLNRRRGKVFLSLGLFCVPFILSGCSDMTEIEDRNFIQTIGVDYVEEELHVYYLLPDLQVLTGQGAAEPESLMISLKGNDFIQVEEEYYKKYNKRLDFSHLKAMVLGENFAKDSNCMKDLFEYVNDNYDLGRTTYIFISKTSAEDIMNLNGELLGGLGNYLDDMLSINLSNKEKKGITIGDLLASENGGSQNVGVPILVANENAIQMSGLGYIYKNQLTDHVSEVEEKYINILKENGDYFYIYFNETTKDTEEAKGEYVIKLSKINSTQKYQWINQKPSIAFNIEGSGEIEMGATHLDSQEGVEKIDLEKKLISKEQNIKLLEQRCNQILEVRITEVLLELLQTSHIDFMNLYRNTSIVNRKIWFAYEGNETGFLDDLSFEVNCKIHMKE